MKTPVYHLWVDTFTKDGQLIPIHQRKMEFGIIGYVVGEITNPETVWELTNHSCWCHSDIIEQDGCTYEPTENNKGYTNDDICFEGSNGLWWVAKSCGWETVNSIEAAEKFLRHNAFWPQRKLLG